MINVPKKWRELPKNIRLEIPSKEFNIDKKTIEKIRDIADPKQRLTEAAKIQYDLFKDIHSYLTTWIAGYGSDVIIRQKFGSTKKLLNLFFNPIKFPKKIKPSWADIKRRIKIPNNMTKDLAYETGVHIGDGGMHIWKHKNKKHKSYFYTISGDLTNEKEYHKEYIKNLMKKLYNINISVLERQNKNNIDSRIKSKAIIEFKNKILKLPIGKKSNIEIPKEILKNKEFVKKCVAGIIDTDFSVTSSLAITGKLASLKLVKQISNILNNEEISHILKIYKNYGRFYINKKGALKIIKEWKLKNPKHTSKYFLLQKFKKFIPYSTTRERLAILEGKLDIKKLEEICKKRKEPQ